MIVRQPTSFKVRLIAGVLAMSLLVVGYKWLSIRQHDINPKDTTIPNFSQMMDGVRMCFNIEHNGHYWIVSDVMATGRRLFTGLAVGISLSLFLGLLIGCFHVLGAILVPPLTFVSKIPPTALLAVFFVLFGTDSSLFVAFIGFGILPQLTLAVCTAVNNDVQMDLIYKAYTLGGSHTEIVYEVIWKQVLPRILQNVQLTIGPAMVFLIAAEWMMADQGFGYRLRIQSRLLNLNIVYIYLIILGVFGFLVDWALVQSRRKLCAWFGE